MIAAIGCCECEPSHLAEGKGNSARWPSSGARLEGAQVAPNQSVVGVSHMAPYPIKPGQGNFNPPPIVRCVASSGIASEAIAKAQYPMTK
jgi:hypothetical protein